MQRVLCIGGSVTAGSGASDQAHAWPALLSRSTNCTPILHYKNAVGPSYFLHCSSNFFNENVSAIILDLGSNIWDRFERLAMERVVALALSANVPVGVVGWANPSVLHFLKLLRNVTLLSVNTSAYYYADDVHPNNGGHVLIANAIQTFLQFKPRYSLLKPHTDHDEVCSEARVLPHTATRWKLVNQGRGTVEKWGWWGDEHVGDLTVNITEMTKHLRAPSYVVGLSYLRTVHPSALSLSCINCECTSIRGYWSWKETPFPVVHTAITKNLRITDTTSFTIISRNSCLLTISSTNFSRIDGLSLRVPTESDIVNAARGNGAQKRFASSNKINAKDFLVVPEDIG
jgi:hypothetical protein